MKHFIVFLCLFMLVPKLFLRAQENKLRVAVFDPNISGKAFDEGAGIIIREMVSSALVNTNKYIIIERSLIDKIINEQKFSNSGIVDDSQISEIGKLAGANKVVSSVLSSAGDKGLLSLKMIDVETAKIESQKTRLVKQSEILDVITTLTLELIGEQIPAAKQTYDVKESVAEQTVSENKTNSPVNGANILLEFKGFKSNKNPDAAIFVDGVKAGTGTLNEGFSISFNDTNPGKHKVSIEWSGNVDYKTFTINTASKRNFVFEYAKTGFGYAMQLKN
jgi:hypothetical protein